MYCTPATSEADLPAGATQSDYMYFWGSVLYGAEQTHEGLDQIYFVGPQGRRDARQRDHAVRACAPRSQYRESSAPTAPLPRLASSAPTERSRIAWLTRCASGGSHRWPTAMPCLEGFRHDYNARFGSQPASDHDAHRKLIKAERVRLDDIFSWQESRAVMRLDSAIRQGDLPDQARSRHHKIAGQHVTVFDCPDGPFKIHIPTTKPWRKATQSTTMHGIAASTGEEDMRARTRRKLETFAAGVRRRLRLAAEAAHRIAPMYGTPVYILENGKIVAKRP